MEKGRESRGRKRGRVEREREGKVAELGLMR